MYKFFLFCVFITVFVVRWMTLESPLPESWTPESKVRFTATITQEVEYTDSQTIVRSGIWYIKMKGYAVIIPGSRVAFVGKVSPKLLGIKVTQIVMVDPTFEVIAQNACDKRVSLDCLTVRLDQLRHKWVNILEKTLPEPMSSLAAGILLGVKSQIPQEFYDQLVSTGTLHIVAASGFNVSVVATVLMNLLGGVVSRGVGIVFGIIGIVVYVLMAGGSASVLRAGIMGSLTLIAYYLGRPAEARRLLWVTGAIMLLINPLMLIDIGFQLSYVATAGLLYIEPWISTHCWKNKFLNVYLYPTLAASISTFPVILYHFGRVSLITPVVNMLVLPVVPLIMFLTAVTIGVGSLSLSLGQVIAWILYGPLWWMVWVIEWWG